jgi:hypothetical protein
MRGPGLRALLAGMSRMASRWRPRSQACHLEGMESLAGNAARAFLAELIDYAGLFPPARLDLDAAIHAYSRYRRESEAWMLGRFVMPAARLAELAPYHEELFAAEVGSGAGAEVGAGANAGAGTGAAAGTPAPYRFSVLIGGVSVNDSSAILAQARSDAEAIREFEERHGTAVRAEVLETRLPDGVFAEAGAGAVVPYLVGLRAVLAGTGRDDRDLFVELPGGAAPAPAELHAAAVAAVAQCDSAGRTESRGKLGRLGIKLRCGGETAAAFPPPEHVARMIALCRDRGVALKCTAGLHHPLRRPALQYGAVMHGFANLFGAGLLAAAHGLDRERIATCIADENPADFHLDADGFAWRDERLDTKEIRQGRADLMTSYGSCSFDEPREDLRELGWLDGTSDRGI